MAYFETTIGSGFVFNSHTVILTGFKIMEGYATITIDGIPGYIYSGQIKNIAGVNATLDYMDSTTGKAGMYLSETVTPTPTVSGKEYVFEFSGQINQTSLIVLAANKIVALLGGKSVYIEGNKLVVVM